ncbi:Hypothetical_protein [Hexamita inflata]|uniref:Hypothetical_protein n=1 Tax=Hexamita inflata TaxID=28002 RepID=A0AA86TFA2_9EUKA|nr:Hypothetical protein HINF_LOCUS4679 [Hexamita inflata]
MLLYVGQMAATSVVESAKWLQNHQIQERIHPPLFEYRHPSSFQKLPGCLQVRANLVQFGIFSVSDLVFHFSYRHLSKNFLKISSFLIQFAQITIIQKIKQHIIYIYGHTKFKSSKKFSKYKRDLQCSIHLQPLLQFSYRHLYYKKSKVSISEHFGCLQVKGGGCLNSRLCSTQSQAHNQCAVFTVPCIYLILYILN